MYKEDCHSMLCFTIILSVAIWSVQLLPARHSACSSRSFLSSAVLIPSKITLRNTLLAMFKSLMPRRFLRWFRSPFFGSLISKPYFIANLSSIPLAPTPYSISGYRGPKEPPLTLPPPPPPPSLNCLWWYIVTSWCLPIL